MADDPKQGDESVEETPATEETPAEETVTETETVEVDEAVEEKIADAIHDSVVDKVWQKLASTDKFTAKTVGTTKVKEGFESMPKEMLMGKQLIAAVRGDQPTLSKLNTFNRNKAGYANETTNADGAYLVPPADFEADVLKLQESYGAARQGGVRVVRTNSNALTLNLKGSGVTMYSTAEAGVKTGTKMTFERKTVSLIKYAAIAPVTDELEEDAAVDIYNELTQDFAREKSRIEDVTVFTHATTGITNVAGTNIIVAHASDIANITADHLNRAVYGVPTQSSLNGKFFVNRAIFGSIQRLKDSQNNYLFNSTGVGGQAGVVGNIWGRPVILTEALAGTNAANEGFVVYGDLSNYTLIEKRGLVLDLLREGTVHDASGVAVNLGEQDMKALRAVTRLNGLAVFPNAFSVIGTGTVS